MTRRKAGKNDLRFEVRVKVKNDLILTKMEEAGIKSVSALAREVGLSPSVVHCLVNMTTLPVTKERRWKGSVGLLAEFFRCSPDDLFSDEQQEQVLETNCTYIETSFAETQEPHVLIQMEDHLPEEIVSGIEKNQCVKNALATLTPRQQEVLYLRFGLEGYNDMTFEEVGKILDISGERARQIAQKALYRLRRGPRANLLKDFS